MVYPLALLLLSAPPETLTGKVLSLSDGDTLKILVGREPIKVRLSGIDAPEKGQPFGTQAQESLAHMVFGKTVSVEATGQDRYGRTVGVVLLGDLDVNWEMVRQGLAWRYPPSDRPGRYRQAEREARDAQRGLWADPSPMPPWEWRKTERERRKAKQGRDRKVTN